MFLIHNTQLRPHQSDYRKRILISKHTLYKGLKLFCLEVQNTWSKLLRQSAGEFGRAVGGTTVAVAVAARYGGGSTVDGRRSRL